MNSLTHRFRLSEKMINKRKVIQLSAVFFMLLLATISCKKKENSLGSSIQPDGDVLLANQTDTLSIITYTVQGDSVRTDELAGNSLLGSYNDPFFGKTKANLYTHIRLQSAIDFTPKSGDFNDLVIDSVVLYLELKGNYGNLQEQNFEVYQLTESIYKDSVYYSNTSKSVAPVNLVVPNQGVIRPDPFSPAFLGPTLQSSPLLKIPLDVNNFGWNIVAQSGNDPLQNNDGENGFVNWFKGLVITTNTSQNPNEGAILYIDLLSTKSKITMYYRDNSGAPSEYDTLKFDFNINANCAYFNQYEKDYTSTAVSAQLADSTLGQQTAFFQNMAGVKTMVYFPYLNELKGRNLIVNKAQLVLSTQYYVYDPYMVPFQLSLTRRGETGTLLLLPDFSEGEVGIFRSTISAYTFNITRYVNQVIAGKMENTPLRLLSVNEALSANRVIINGGNTNLKDKPKLILTFTEY
jgi:hypothetical protein